jgi:hypothetical protein
VPAAGSAEPGAVEEKPEDKSVPFWTRPDARAREGLGTATRSLSGAVLLVGHPKVGIGTAWVLSIKHRLLVTNAHVADMIGQKGRMLAIVNGTEQVHKVKRAWYHPGVRRQASGGISIRAECPVDGPVDPWSPDVAVLELAEGDDLSAELVMATPKELKSLFAQTVGMLGFPAHSTGKLVGPGRQVRVAWPALGEKAQATYHDGVISRLTNFRLSVDVPEEELQFVQTTLGNWPGFSGSPIYLSNGHVVAINNSWRQAEARGVKVQISQAIRVDCLWELLVHHGLDRKVPVPIDRSRLNIKRWLVDSAADKQFRRAIKMVEDAASLIDTQEFMAGVKKCDAAIKIAPTYAEAYRVRCAGLNNYYSYRQPGSKEARAILLRAVNDASSYARLMSSDPRALTSMVNTANNLTVLMSNSSYIRASLTNLDRALSSSALTVPQRAEFHSLRGVCRFNLRNRAGARRDFDESIRLDPSNDVLFDNRARFWDAIDEEARASADRARARAIRKRLREESKETD